MGKVSFRPKLYSKEVKNAAVRGSFSMKILSGLCIASFLLAAGTLCQAQQAVQQGASTSIPAPTPYTIISRDASSRIWESTSYALSPSGQVIPHVHQYTELASGLCYQQNGQWVDSQEQINILPDGSAAATNGQNQAYFPADIYNGVIKLEAHDGIELQSQPVALSYDDGSNTVIIAALTNSIGQLISSNQVIYTNAFFGVDADLLYTYRKGGFEQDVVLREQPPTPESLGLNPQTATLQVLTEFFNPPQPTINSVNMQTEAGEMTDDNLDFGATKIIPGKAFLLGTNEPDVAVTKEWANLNGRQLLVESAPVESMANDLNELPTPATAVTLNVKFPKALTAMRLPKHRLAKTNRSFISASKVTLPTKGMVLDYVTINSGLTNYVFRGDTTYYISGTVDLFGTNIMEGGTVLKYASTASLYLMESSPLTSPQPVIIWPSTPYRPAILTAHNDNTVGDTVSSGGAVFFGGPSIIYPGGYPNQIDLGNFQMKYFSTGIQVQGGAESMVITNAQFDHGLTTAIYSQITGGKLTLENVLFANISPAAIECYAPTIIAKNCTFANGSPIEVISPYAASFCCTNCIFANMGRGYYGSDAPSLYFNYNGFYQSTNWGSIYVNSTFNPFQVVGGGSYYLTNGCAFTNGTANIDPALLGQLASKTTYPPTVFSNQTFSVSTNFTPQVPRDTNASPNLGYHYDPLDYVFGGCNISNTVTFAPGTAVGWFQANGSALSSPYAISLTNGASVSFNGTATQPDIFANYLMVQEGTNVTWTNSGLGGIVINGSGNTPLPQLSADFTKWTADGRIDVMNGSSAYGLAGFLNCEFYNAGLASFLPSISFTNCLFFRDLTVFSDTYTNAGFALDNCTFYNGGVSMARTSTYTASFWEIENSSFDGTCFTWADSFSGTNMDTLFNYNAYNADNVSWTNYPYLNPPTNGTLENVGAQDVMVTNYNWQTSWFGNFYLSTNSPLITAGSTNANGLGLYHFTTQTNQTMEGTNKVDIGYHYVATDTNGNPLDSNGDGIPDYLEDPLGNGLSYNGTNWALAINIQPTNQTVLQGTNATLSVTAGGVPPLAYQWYFNSNALAFQTSTTLVYNPASTNDAGNYFVVVTNNFGAVTSSVATLIVLAPPTIEITNPFNNQVIGSNDTNITLMASVSDFAGTVTQVQFYQGSTSLGVATSLPYDLVWSNATSGNYALTAVATDNYGLVSTSLVVNVFISPLFATNNLILWLQANAIIGLTNNGSVSNWPDSSGWTNNATQTSLNQKPFYVTNALNRLPVVQFRGLQFLNIPSFPTSLKQAEGIVVVQATSLPTGNNYQTLWVFGNYNNISAERYPFGDGSILENFASGTGHQLGIPPQPLTQYNVYEICSQSNNWEAWMNQMPLFQTTNNSVVINNYQNNGPTLGNNYYPNSFNGNIAEVLVFNRGLSSAERNTVNVYLDTKYGLVSALPATPTNLTATAISPTQIALAWNELLTNGLVTQTVIERSTNDMDFAAVGEVSDASSYIDTNLIEGTTYYYEVQSINLTQWSPVSDVAQATTLTNGVSIPFGNLALWLEAGAGLLNEATNAPVNLWLDQSGNGNNAIQLTAINQPAWVPSAMGTRPAIQFNGTNSGFNFPNPNSLMMLTQAEAIVVLEVGNETNGNNALWQLGTEPDFSSYPDASGMIEDNFGTTPTQIEGTPQQSLNQFHIYDVVSGSTNWASWIDGIPLDQTPNNPPNFSDATSLGYSSYNYWGQGYFDGDIAEVLIFNRPLTSCERTAVNTYLNGKYDLGPTVWITSPTNATVFNGISNIGLSASAFPIGSGTVQQVQYFQGSSSIGFGSGPSFSLTWSNVQVGAYALTAVATDGNGLTSTSSIVNVTVDPVPSVSFISPSNNAVFFTEETNVTLTAIAGDNGGTISQVQFLNGSTSLGIFTNSSYSLVFSNVTAGVYSITVVATDNYGFSANSTVHFVVTPVQPAVVSIGGEWISEVTSNGNVASWGGNQYGELADYTYLPSDAPLLQTNAPVCAIGLSNIVQIASGLDHSLAVDSNGVLRAWGYDDWGQLGDGNTNQAETTVNLPEQISGMTNIVSIAAYGEDLDAYSAAVKADGTVWSWGSKFFNYAQYNTNVPEQIQGFTNAVAVAIGTGFPGPTVILLDDGTVWCSQVDWGSSNTPPYQLLGLSNIVAICTSEDDLLALDINGIVWSADSSGLNPPISEGISNIVKIASGDYHSLAIDSSGQLWAWGDDSYGQFGDGGVLGNSSYPVPIPGITNIISISAGSDASTVWDVYGNLWQFGSSDDVYPPWPWGDEYQLPVLAPQYTDFYNGNLPNLTILGGNNQTTYGTLEFPLPLVFKVTDTNGVGLSNAPVSVQVISGDMQFTNSAACYTGLRLTTDVNGEVSLIGLANNNVVNTSCIIRVLAASGPYVREIDFYETVVPQVYPTLAITSPVNGINYLLSSNQTMTVTVGAGLGSGASIQQVDYTISTNGGNNYSQLDEETTYPFSFTWTNTAWWSNAFYSQYILSAVAEDNLGLWSASTNVTFTIALDSTGNGLPDYWQLQYFNELGVDTNSSPDGNGQSLLYDYLNGFDPTDYYDGLQPQLNIVSGNDEGGNYGSFLSAPIVVQVTDPYGGILTNAPLTFTVTNGSALITTSVAGLLTNTIPLRTDSNGLASVWVYFPTAGLIPADSTIVVSAMYDETNTVSVTANEYIWLGHWTFNDTNTWVGDEGQLPLVATNVVGTSSWSSNAVLVDSANSASISYNIVETNGNTNINFQNGSVVFYFRPDWDSVDYDTGNGTGPGTYGRLIEAGAYNPAYTNSWWSLYLSPDGDQLFFATSTNGGGMTNLTADISSILLTSNTWYQFMLTYSPTGSAAYIDGQLVGSGCGITNWSSDGLTNGFRIGSDQCGNNQAAGAFDELQTFDTPLVTAPQPADTYWFGIPDYKAAPDGTQALANWEMEYFGYYGLEPNYDPYDTGNGLLYDYTNGLTPNSISFSVSFPSQYISTSVATGLITVWGGMPSDFAVLVDSTNFSSASWSAYNLSNVTVNLGSTDGAHDVWIGLVGSTLNAQPTWVETTLVLDSALPTISITNPTSCASFNSSRVNVGGNFTVGTLQQITVNGVPAFVNGTNFEVLNVPLVGGTNTITAVIQDISSATNAASIVVIGLTNSDGSMNSPVQLQATPAAGFAPMDVTFSVQANVPGTVEQVIYDFNGDGIPDFVTNNTGSLTYTYETNGEYFPVVTIQTTAGSFSSIGGWNAGTLDPDNQPIQINVQAPLSQTVFADVSDPVAIKWSGNNLYILSGSGATITKFCTNGTPMRTLSNLGINPTGFDVDGSGNIYVAMTSSNQVWKFIPTNGVYIADTNFGNGGFVGTTNGAAGTTNGQFNAPFDVAVSPDGGTISVSDTGNNRIQQFSAYNGTLVAVFGTNGNNLGQFNSPEGLMYDSVGNLYIVDSGNNRIVFGHGSVTLGVTGTNGTALGQFNGPVNICANERGVYVADTGNNRIQSFSPPEPDYLFNIDPSSIRFDISSGLSEPAAVAAASTLTNETFYIADTDNNRVLFYNVQAQDPTPAWASLTAHVANGDIQGALANFSVDSVDNYRQAFLSVGTTNAISALNQIGVLTPVYIKNDRAEYYFTNTIDGQVITFPVLFDKENGVWKVLEF